MGGCAAPFCNNSAKKGYVMKVFPRDPERRALWQQNVPRENWTATNNSYLCEMHFSPEMWEQRCDGKRKLKPGAVPTIFGFFMKKNNTDTSRNEQISKEHAKEEQLNIEDLECNTIKNTAEYMSANDIPESNIVDAVLSTTAENNTAECILTTSTSDTCISESENLNNEQLCTEKCNEVIKKAKLRMIIMQKKMKVMKSKLHSLQQKINNDKYKKALQGIFNEDQIAVLCTKCQKSKNWSNETVQRSLKLKLACGTNGYEEILRQGLPFPSLRTIQRRLDRDI